MKNLILKDLLPGWLHEFAGLVSEGQFHEGTIADGQNGNGQGSADKDSNVVAFECKIAFSNEYELQENLICFLRYKLASAGLACNYTVDKEVKIDFAFNDPNFKAQCGKEIIDVVIFKGLCIKKTEEKYAIELKYPHKKAYPFMMYSCVKDIAFMEEAQDLWNTGVVNPFDGSYCLTFVDDHLFYSGEIPGPIYSHFRPVGGTTAPIHGTIPRPNKGCGMPLQLNISGSYMINWLPCGKYHYYLVVI